ncbi:alpha-ketoglutarate-dependent dioxygenase AlkB [Neiella sp. HB171785]|uniref:Alpha-ketoglutarate-dependent dioxygenase AlkB n=2 Tax=Neiella litorisoli TaxID=2771431 RepID=A0A8J6QTH8_9GAMM|nr:alpha-ketoglutarate-dependent dioxygenase AlkB [Neiella litorisoli]
MTGWQTLGDSQFGWWPDFVAEQSCQLWQQLMAQVTLQTGIITVFGKRHRIPRLQAWFGPKPYRYSGETLPPQALPPVLELLMAQAMERAQARFDSVLVNYYRDGRDHMGWHSDDEPELGANPVIASLSLGAARDFDLRHRHSKQRIRLSLSDGSLLVMAGRCQHEWQHALPKRLRIQQPRINLTFRNLAG